MKKWFAIYLLLSVALVSFISCGLSKNTIDFDYNLFLREKNAWEQSKPDNYQYKFFRSNPGFDPEMSALIFVENGQYKGQIPDEGAWLVGASSDFQTIDDIFGNIENIYKTNYDDRLLKINIEYDITNHIPIKTEFFYDYDGVLDMGNYLYYKIENYQIDP